MTPLSITAQTSWIPTRAEGLRRLSDFVPRAGKAYAARRNFDLGPSARSDVSGLSPYVRHRLVTETEVLSAVLSHHSASSAEKFVSEVFWRTYWKGWLEAHPTAWTRYRAELDARCAQIAAAGHHATYEGAVAGQTGIDAFDAWVHELVTLNYLHNHTRMWFASIWIFTLRLPWELGADFFLRHLLDGDPASNTLSWRWVAGLHTRGKSYLARPDNIRFYTGDRFELAGPPLARSAVAVGDATLELADLPGFASDEVGSRPALLLLHDDDLLGDGWGLPANLRGVAALRATAGRSPHPVSAGVVAFEAQAARAAIATIAIGAIANHGLIAGGDPGAGRAIAAAAHSCGARCVVVPFAPCGPVRSALSPIRAAIEHAGLVYVEIARPYDRLVWPVATRGFFALRSRIPGLLTQLGIGSR